MREYNTELLISFESTRIFKMLLLQPNSPPSSIPFTIYAIEHAHLVWPDNNNYQVQYPTIE